MSHPVSLDSKNEIDFTSSSFIISLKRSNEIKKV